MSTPSHKSALNPAVMSESGPVAEILRIIRAGERFLVISHERPDGDAIGSVLAFGELLRQLGKSVDMVTADRVPAAYRGLPDAANLRTATRVDGPYDAVIMLECDGLERAGVEGLEQFPLINIDHHITAHPYASVNWIDCEAVSVGEMVHRLAKFAGVKITPAMATCLYTTVLTDTGGFCYGSLRGSTFALARELVDAGANAAEIAKQIYFTTPLSKVRLMSAALENLHCEGQLAWLWITEDDMHRLGATEEDVEGIANVAIGIAGIEAAAFARALNGNEIRMSLRSKGRVNVAVIAEKLGGGGHKNSSGCTLDGPLDLALDRIIAELKAQL
jgi:bifunctional oligoribonuclease and PAP phosphatase NrnA